MTAQSRRDAAGGDHISSGRSTVCLSVACVHAPRRGIVYHQSEMISFHGVMECEPLAGLTTDVYSRSEQLIIAQINGGHSPPGGSVKRCVGSRRPERERVQHCCQSSPQFILLRFAQSPYKYKQCGKAFRAPSGFERQFLHGGLHFYYSRGQDDDGTTSPLSQRYFHN